MELKWKGEFPLEDLQIENIEVRTDTLYKILTEFDLDCYAELSVEKKVEEIPTTKDKKKGKKEVEEA